MSDIDSSYILLLLKKNV